MHLPTPTGTRRKRMYVSKYKSWNYVENMLYLDYKSLCTSISCSIKTSTIHEYDAYTILCNIVTSWAINKNSILRMSCKASTLYRTNINTDWYNKRFHTRDLAKASWNWLSDLIFKFISFCDVGFYRGFSFITLRYYETCKTKFWDFK